YKRLDGSSAGGGGRLLPPRPLIVYAPWERAAPRSGARYVLRTQWNTIVVQDLWPISDHMQSSKQDVTSDIIAYYV
ncbi:unnamed protein product, partial [Staurois parvus]